MSLTRRRRVLLQGPVLIGFGSMFDRSYGDPRTPKPYPKVTPSRIGAALLPFACPHCSAVRPAVVDVRKYGGYSDSERGFSWCPACRGRYVVNFKGMPLSSTLPASATHAPALVERRGKTEVIGVIAADGLHVLGAG